MKVLYISGSMPDLQCGIAHYSKKLVPYIAENDSISVLTSSGLDTMVEEKNSYFVPGWQIWRVPKMLSAIKKAKPKVISIQYPAKGYKRHLGINILPYFIRRTPVVVTLHEYHGSGLLGKTRNFITCLPVTRIIVSNPYDLQSLPLVLRHKAEIIPIGSNIEKVSSDPSVFDEICTKAGFSNNKPVGVFFGYAFPNKGLDLLLKSAYKTNSQLLLLCGLNKSNPYQKELLDKIDSYNERGAKIYCAGHLDDKPVSQILRRCDYFALTQPLPLTAKSGTTIAAVEHGLPVISTGADNKNLNLPYIHNENAFLLNPMNKETLSKLLNEINKDGNMLKDLNAGVTKLAQNFDWNSIANTHREVWKRCLKDE